MWSNTSGDGEGLEKALIRSNTKRTNLNHLRRNHWWASLFCCVRNQRLHPSGQENENSLLEAYRLGFQWSSKQDLPKAKGLQGSGARRISWSVLCCSNIIPKAKIKIKEICCWEFWKCRACYQYLLAFWWGLQGDSTFQRYLGRVSHIRQEARDRGETRHGLYVNSPFKESSCSCKTHPILQHQHSSLQRVESIM